MSDPARCPVTDEYGARCFRDAGHDLLPGAVPGCYFGVNEPTPRRQIEPSMPDVEIPEACPERAGMRVCIFHTGHPMPCSFHAPNQRAWTPAGTGVMTLTHEWRCQDCYQTTDRMLTAPDPFEIGDELLACPNCRAVMGSEFTVICDEPGCTEDKTCGWMAPTGYRTTCHTHQETP